MAKTVKARYQAGHIQPLEPLQLADGSEIMITVMTPEPGTATTGTGRIGHPDEDSDQEHTLKQRLVALIETAESLPPKRPALDETQEGAFAQTVAKKYQRQGFRL